MKQIRHFLEYLLAFVLVLALIFAIASVIIVKFYGDDVKEYALEIINQQVETKIQVEEIGVGIFRNFPYTSVFFRDVVVWSGHGFRRGEFPAYSRDTLLTAQSVSLQFNLFDLARKQYDVRRLSVTNGTVRLLTDSLGGNNFTIRPDHPKKESKNLFIDLRAFQINGIRLEIINHAKQHKGSMVFENVQLDGNFSSEEYMLNLSGTALLERWSTGGIQYVENQHLESDVSFIVRDNLYTINRGRLDLGYILADLEGSVLIDHEKGMGADLDLNLDARKVDIPWILDLLSRQGSLETGKIRARGKADITADITGMASPVLSPHIVASFSLVASEFSADPLPVAIRSVDLAGRYTNGRLNALSSTLIELHTLRFRAGNSSVDATIQAENLLEPVYYLHVGGAIDVSDINQFFTDLPLVFRSGTLVPDLKVSGRITGRSGDRREITFIPGGSIKLEDAAFGFRDATAEISEISGTIDMEKYTWKSSFEGIIGESEVSLSFTHNNPVPFLAGTGDLDVSARLTGDVLNLDALFPREKNRERAGGMRLPERLYADVGFEFGSVRYNNITASRVRGMARYIFPSLLIDDFHADAWNGTVDARAGIASLDRPVKRFNINANARNLDIDGVFNAFQNFNQDAITSDNLKGAVSLVSEFAAEFNAENTFDRSSIVSENHVVIRNGELIDFEPLEAVSRILKIDRMDRVTFSTIENNILIKDGSITIPEMNIESSAINVNASGSQGFNGTYRYHLAVKLSEILFKKAQSAADREFEVALDEEDQRTVFLILYNEGKGMTVEFDEEKAVKKLKDDLREEKQELKTILNDEFGIFKKDSIMMEKREKSDDPVLKFEFSDGSEEEDKKEESGKKRWWQRSPDKKEKLDFVIEDNGL